MDKGIAASSPNGGNLQSNEKTENEGETAPEAAKEEDLGTQPLYSTFSNFEKKFYAWVASVAAFTSPVSSTIYYPAIASIAKDLNTSIGNINLTITTFLVLLES
jgi:hypothetical protein